MNRCCYVFDSIRTNMYTYKNKNNGTKNKDAILLSFSNNILTFCLYNLHQVTFSSLDVHLHTEALLNTMNFLTNLLPPSTKKEGGQEELPTIPEEDEAEKEEEKKEEATVTRKKSNWS